MKNKQSKIDTHNLIDEIKIHNNRNGMPQFEITKTFIDEVESKGVDLKDVIDFLRCVGSADIIKLASKIITNFYRNTYTHFNYRFLMDIDTYPYSDISIEVKTDDYQILLNLSSGLTLITSMSIEERDAIIKRQIVDAFVNHFVNYQS